MSARDVLLSRAQRVAGELGALATSVTLVGGTSPALYGMSSAVTLRPTSDVDLVIEASSALAWHRFVHALEDRGFRAAASGPVCRYQKADLIVDVMTTTAEPLGFTNRWYAAGVAERQRGQGAALHVIRPLHFIATKLDAYEDRGAGDPFSSHDLEDIFVVVRGVADVVKEIGTGSDPVHAEVRRQLRALLSGVDALEIVRAHLEPDVATQALGPRLLSSLRDACRVV